VEGLDTRAAVPPAPSRGGSVGCAVVAVDVINAENGADEPDDCAQEDEGNISLPLRAGVGAAADGETRPVEDVAAGAVQPVDEQAEGDEPADTDEQVCRPVDEAAAEGEEPDDGEQNRQTSDDLCVDESTLVPG
jgi:hypothetical protein